LHIEAHYENKEVILSHTGKTLIKSIEYDIVTADNQRHKGVYYV
jgi:hypothetical protein